MIVPDITELYVTHLYENTKGAIAQREENNGEPEINDYYEGFLTENDARKLIGFEFASEDVETAICNLENDDEFEEFTNFDTRNIDLDRFLDYARTEYDPFDVESEEHKDLETLSEETKLCMLFYKNIVNTILDAKNDLGVAIMDGYAVDKDLDAQYQKNRQGYFNGTYRNCLERYKEEYAEPTSKEKRLSYTNIENTEN